jgi:hypothetical protein
MTMGGYRSQEHTENHQTAQDKNTVLAACARYLTLEARHKIPRTRFLNFPLFTLPLPLTLLLVPPHHNSFMSFDLGSLIQLGDDL